MWRKPVLLHDEVSDGGVERAQWVVEQADVGVSIERTRKTHARFLSARQHDAFLTHQSQVAMRKIQNVLKVEWGQN